MDSVSHSIRGLSLWGGGLDLELSSVHTIDIITIQVGLVLPVIFPNVFYAQT